MVKEKRYKRVLISASSISPSAPYALPQKDLDFLSSDGSGSVGSGGSGGRARGVMFSADVKGGPPPPPTGVLEGSGATLEDGQYKYSHLLDSDFDPEREERKEEERLMREEFERVEREGEEKREREEREHRALEEQEDKVRGSRVGG